MKDIRRFGSVCFSRVLRRLFAISKPSLASLSIGIDRAARKCREADSEGGTGMVKISDEVHAF